MRNVTTIPQGTKSKEILLNITTTLKSILEGILNLPKVLFGKQDPGDPMSNTPKVTGVKVLVTGGTGDDPMLKPTTITTITITTETGDIIDKNTIVKLVFNSNTVPDYTIPPVGSKKPKVSKDGNTYTITKDGNDNPAFLNPNKSLITVYSNGKLNNDNVTFTYT